MGDRWLWMVLYRLCVLLANADDRFWADVQRAWGQIAGGQHRRGFATLAATIKRYKLPSESVSGSAGSGRGVVGRIVKGQYSDITEDGQVVYDPR